MTLEELAAEINRLYESLKEPLARDPHKLIDELDYRCAWLARSAELLADAQYYLDQKRGQQAARQDSMDVSPSLAKQIIEGNCALEKKIFVLAEKLNSTITHQIDAVRSILSFEKQGLINVQ